MLSINPSLWERYDQAGPRYTSYPTAEHFKEDIGVERYKEAIKKSNQESIPSPLSLYCHIPFCSTLCYYCACNKIHTKNETHIKDYLTRLNKEITLQASLMGEGREVTQLHWGGGTPNVLSHPQMNALMEKISRHFNLCDQETRDFSIELDPRTITPNTLGLIRQIGFNRVSFGVQDFDPAVQRAVNRIQSEEETGALIQEARHLGFGSINMDLMYGLPLQTSETFSRTLEKVIQIRPDRIAIYHYAHMPLYFAPQRRINAKTLPTVTEKWELLLLAICQLTTAGYEYIGFDHFSLPTDALSTAKHKGTLQRNFQGYTTHAKTDLVGLGVSAIGRVQNTLYSQNYKGMREYRNAIDNGRLPISQGIALSSDDLIRNEVIQSLMCYVQVHFPVIEYKYGITFHTYFESELERLRSFEQEKLVEITEKYLTVMPMGQMFLRNICREFDAYRPKSTKAR